jgi:integrase
VGVRFRKYLPLCKDIDCKGKKGRYCPPDRPKNKLNGEYKKCGTWVVELFDESNCWKTIAFRDVKNKRDAGRRLSLLIGDRERGNLKLPKKGKIATLKEYCQTYLEYSKNDKENTLSNKVGAVKSITKYIGHYKLDKITKFIIEKYRIDRKENDAVKDVTINLDIAILTHIFNNAIDDDIIDKNPCREVKRYKIEQNRKRVLTEQEVCLIIDRLAGKDRLMVLIGLLDGLRLNETLKLEWRDIDFNKSMITFLQSKTGKLVSNPISKFLLEELYGYKQNCTGERLFDNREVNSALIKEYSAYFSKLFKSLGIGNFTYHNLRHCFSTFQSDSGADAFTTQSLLGHASLSQTAQYTHTRMEIKRNNIETMTEYILKMNEKTKITNFSSDQGTT